MEITRIDYDEGEPNYLVECSRSGVMMTKQQACDLTAKLLAELAE